MVDVYFEQVLLPDLPVGSVSVLDNARFRQSPTTQRLVEAAGCHLLFLPAYSSDLNSIEHLSLDRFQDPSVQRPGQRYQPLPFYRQYVPMLLLIAILSSVSRGHGKIMRGSIRPEVQPGNSLFTNNDETKRGSRRSPFFGASSC